MEAPTTEMTLFEDGAQQEARKVEWDWKMGHCGLRVLMNSGLDMLTLRGLWGTPAGNLDTNLEFRGEQDVGNVE